MAEKYLRSRIHFLRLYVKDHLPDRIERILWAVDIFARDDDLPRRMAYALHSWTGNRPTVIEPVYVMSAHLMQMPPYYFIKNLDALVDRAKARLNDRLKVWSYRSTADSKVLVCDSSSTRRCCSVLLEYARETSANLIALTTHSRIGVPRLVLGSFAESLIQVSEVPLYIVSLRTRPLSVITDILVPTDLSPTSIQVFPSIVAVARQLRARISLLHVCQFLRDHGDATFGAADSYYEHLARDLNERQELLNQLVVDAGKTGVGVETTLIKDYISPETAILRMASKLASGIVAMVSQKVGAEAGLLGSVTRKVVRKAQLPVWVVHSDALSAAAHRSSKPKQVGQGKNEAP